MSIGIGTDKAPVVLTQYRSQGDTIPVIAAGTEKVGDIIERGSGMQQIGQVQSLSANDMTLGTGTATAGSEIQVRVFGMIWAPAANATYTDGDLVEWNGSAFEADTTGAHEVVGTSTVDGTAITHILVRMNVALRAATP